MQSNLHMMKVFHTFNQPQQKQFTFKNTKIREMPQEQAELFILDKQCINEYEKYWYIKCKRKRALIEIIFSKAFWTQMNVRRYLTGRLIPINKSYPKIESVNEYKPIIALSAIQKLLSVFLKEALDRYSLNNMSTKQFAFQKLFDRGLQKLSIQSRFEKEKVKQKCKPTFHRSAKCIRQLKQEQTNLNYRIRIQQMRIKQDY